MCACIRIQTYIPKVVTNTMSRPRSTYDFTENPQVSCCTPDIEALFVTITNLNTPITMGVVYRPPNGDINKFKEVFEETLDKLPSKNVYISGDFNINLHKSDNNCTLFEETFIPRGYAPLISLATHEMPHCEKTCIDNIFTNSFDHITFTGTISDKLAHHLPIFSIFSLAISNATSKANGNENIPYYDYCTNNVENFVESVKTRFSTSPECNYNFSGFVGAYTCLLYTSPSPRDRTRCRMPSSA